MELNPIGTADDNVKPTLIRCNNPTWPVAEQVTLDVSVNGQDYSGGFPFTFYESIDVYRIAPMAGPNGGQTRVKLIGSGFNSNTSTEDVFIKWGILETQKLQKD